MRKYCFTLWCFLGSITSLAQTYEVYTQTIRGSVFDKDTKTPLPGAYVILQESDPIIGTTTNADGLFRLDSVTVGRHNILISFSGYHPVLFRQILLTSGKELVLEVELEEQAFALEGVTISARQSRDEVINTMASVSARSFTVKDTERFAGSLGDPSRMAANFAGVSMVDDSRNDIIIRGNSPTGLLWRLDGVEIPNPNHFSAAGTTGGPVSMLNNNLLTNSDFFTSAFPAQYGNAMSGVFDLNMRAGNNQKREYVAQIGFNGFELGAEGPFKKGRHASYLINYRYSVIGLMGKLGLNAGTGDATPYYQDLSFKINVPTKKIGVFTLFGIGGLSNIKIYDSLNPDAPKSHNYSNGGSDIDFLSDTGVLGLSNLYKVNEKTSIQTILSIQTAIGNTQVDSLRYDVNGKFITNSNYRYYGLNARENKYSAAMHLSKKINRRNNYALGLYYDVYKVHYVDSVLLNPPKLIKFRKIVEADGDLSILRGYAQWQHKFSDQFVLNGGLYAQHFFLNRETSLEPRIGAKVHVSKKATIGAGYGLHSQMQPRMYYFRQLRLPDNSYVLTNQDMKLSKSHQFVLSYDVGFKNHFRFKSELYYQNLYSVPVTSLNPAFSMINVGTDFQNMATDSDSLINLGRGKNYGIECTIERLRSKGFYMLTTLSLFNSQYVGYDGVWRSTAFNNNYILNTLGGYEWKIGKYGYLAFDLKLSWAGGKRFVPIDLTASREAKEPVYDWSRAYSKRHGQYFRADVKLSYKMDWKRFNQEWAINFQNITNTKNVFSEYYDSRSETVKIKYQLNFYLAFLYRVIF